MSTSLLDQKSLVDAYLLKGPRPLSSFSFVSLFAWSDFFEFELKIINDCLCIFAHGESGCFLYLPPLGKDFDTSTVGICFKQMAGNGALKPVNRIENIPSNLLSAFGPDRYNQYLKPAEYVYRKEDLIALKGNAYKSKRHDCNSFKLHHGLRSFVPYTDADFGPCVELYERWAGDRAGTNTDEVYRSMLQENRKVHARLLEHWRPLGLIVRLLKVQGVIAGYTFGFAVDENTFCVYAEIVNLTITGAAAYIFNSFCADEELAGFSRINTMDDFAMPQVARAKQAYHPSELVPSYSVTIKTWRNNEY